MAYVFRFISVMFILYGCFSADYVDAATWQFVGGEPTRYPVRASLAKGPGDTLFAGGDSGVAVWTGEQWVKIAKIRVEKIIYHGGKLFATGSFSSIERCPARNIAQWNGTGWSRLGNGLKTTSVAVRVISAAKNGHLYVGGTIDSAGDLPTKYFAAWNGVSWDTSGNGKLTGPVGTIACGDDGSLYVSVGTAIYKKADTGWAKIPLDVSGGGSSNEPLEINALAVGVNGILYAAGLFPNFNQKRFGGGLLRWDGTSWRDIKGTFIDRATEVAFSPAGNLYVIASDGYGTVNVHRISDTLADTCFHARIVVGTASGRVSIDKCGLAVRDDSTLFVNYHKGVIISRSHRSFELISGLAAYIDPNNNADVGIPRIGSIDAISCSGRSVFVQGRNMWFNGKWLGSLAYWNGTTWSSLCGDKAIRSIRATGEASVTVSGQFESIGGIDGISATPDVLDSQHLEYGAKWNNGIWQPIEQWEFPTAIIAGDGAVFRSDSTRDHRGNTLLQWKNNTWDTIGIATMRSDRSSTHFNPAIALLWARSANDVIAGGRFDSISWRGGAAACNNLAKWNGTGWSSMNLPESLSNNNTNWTSVQLLCVAKNGTLYAASDAVHSSNGAVIFSNSTGAWKADSIPDHRGPLKIFLDTADILYRNSTNNDPSYQSGISCLTDSGWTNDNFQRWPSSYTTDFALASNNSLYCTVKWIDGYYAGVVNYNPRQTMYIRSNGLQPATPQIEVICRHRVVYLRQSGGLSQSPMVVALFAIDGKKIRQQLCKPSAGKITIPLPDIPAGVYVVTAVAGRCTNRTKILVTP